MVTSIPCCASVATPSPALGVAASAVLPFLVRLEEVPANAAGALVFGPLHRPAGTIVMEHGRVCWASARTMRRRLTDLLRYQNDPPLAATTVESVYRRCAIERKPLGETLVQQGIVSETQLRRALRQHSSEAVAVLSLQRAAAPRWIPHRHSRYDARFCFSLVDLLISIGALNNVDVARSSRKELASVLDAGGVGFAYHIAPGCALPTPIAAFNADEFKAADVVSLGNWSKDALDIGRACDGSADLVTTTRPGSGGVVAWASAEVLYTAICSNASEVACVIAQRARRRCAESHPSPSPKPVVL